MPEINETVKPKYKSLKDVPKEERVSLIEIFWEKKTEIEGKEKSKWIRVSCDYRCLFATKHICACMCKGKNHQSQGVKNVSNDLVWKWPEMVMEFLEKLKREADGLWSNKFRVKINWSLLQQKGLNEFLNTSTREGKSYQESMEKLLKACSITKNSSDSFCYELEGLMKFERVAV